MKTKKTNTITRTSNFILIAGSLMMLWNFIFNKSSEQITFIAGLIMCLSSISNIF